MQTKKEIQSLIKSVLSLLWISRQSEYFKTTRMLQKEKELFKKNSRKQFPCKNGVIRPTETKIFSKSPLLKWKPHCFAQFLIDNDKGWISLIGQNTFRNLIKMKQQLRQRKTFRINVISATLKIPQRFSTAVKN